MVAEVHTVNKMDANEYAAAKLVNKVHHATAFSAEIARAGQFLHCLTSF